MSQKKRQKKFVKISMTGVAGLKYRLNVYKEKEKREETIHSVFAENRYLVHYKKVHEFCKLRTIALVKN